MHYPLWGLIIGWIIYITLGLFMLLIIISCFGKGGNDTGGEDDSGCY